MRVQDPHLQKQNAVWLSTYFRFDLLSTSEKGQEQRSKLRSTNSKAIGALFERSFPFGAAALRPAQCPSAITT
jgi:hypothetical protein